MANNKVVLGSVTIIDITDTTAVAEDVAQGKTFYGADGNKVVGTASAPTGTLSIAENGTYDVTDYASANVNVSGGGGTPVTQKTVLWSNPSPTSQILEMTTYQLKEDLSNYDLAIVRYRTWYTGTPKFQEMWFDMRNTNQGYPKYSGTRALMLGGTSATSNNTAKRMFWFGTMSEDTTTDFTVNVGTAVNSTNNSHGTCIPHQVIGVKLAIEYE